MIKLHGSVWRLLLLASLGSSVFSISAEELTNVFLKGPYLQGPGSDTMTMKWEAPNDTPSLVRYGLEGKANLETRAQKPRPLSFEASGSVTNVSGSGETTVTRVTVANTVYLYEVALTNLRPDSVYTYQAESAGMQTPAKRFSTFARDQKKVTFIAYGDVRTNPKTHAAVTANFKRYSPNFILHTGDLVANGTRYELWGKEFFWPLANVLDEVPILPSIGNHEADGDKYVFYMRLPGKERYYSYDLGPVHVLALDFHYDKETDAQFAFAEKDLIASTAPWKLVYLHYPVFNVGGHATGWGHASYLPLFHRAKVDLVVTGHSHIYERFLPMAGDTGSDTWPITHITTGGGGAPLAASYPHPAIVSRAATNHFVLFEATATSLKGRVITTNNAVFDTFEWKKRNGQPEAAYMAKIYPEAAMKLFYEAAPSVNGSLASPPGADSPGEAMFTVRPLKATGRPVELEIGLMPESAPFYQLEDGPLRVTAPSANESNKVAWAKVRAVGKAAIDGRSNDLLSPPLRFQARMLVGKAETLAYGQRCRVTDAAAEAAKSRVSQ